MSLNSSLTQPVVSTNPTAPTSKRPPAQVQFLDRVVSPTLCRQNQDKAIALLTGFLAQTFGVEKDEVTFLVLDGAGRELHFFAPEHLLKIGSRFAFDRLQSLAGKALWDRKPYIENHVPLINHLAVFERAKQPGGAPAKIDKMITFPLYVQNSPLGVVQISRKLRTGMAFRENFQARDVEKLLMIESILVRLFLGIRSTRLTKAVTEFPDIDGSLKAEDRRIALKLKRAES